MSGRLTVFRPQTPFLHPRNFRSYPGMRHAYKTIWTNIYSFHHLPVHQTSLYAGQCARF